MAKTIVITGAGLGLGRAIARRFAADGETVVLLGRTLAKVEAVAGELGGVAMAVACDVASPDSVRAAFATIAATHPTIDVLINNAAVFEPFTVAEATDEQLVSTISTNLLGPILCTRAAIPMLGRGGLIVNVSSESVDMPYAMLSIYQASKAGLERLTRSLGMELEDAGIRLSVVRAGSMVDADDPQAPNWDPAAAGRFFQINAARGIDMATKPISSVTSVTDVFRAVVDLPPDVHLPHISVEARKP